MLLSGAAALNVAGILRPRHFHRPGHTETYRAMLSIMDRSGKGSAIDLLTLEAELARSGKLADAGGADYLLEIAESTPSPANAEYYAEIVLEKWQRRMLQAAGQKLIDAASNGKLPAAAIVTAEQTFAVIHAETPGGIPVVIFGEDFEPVVLDHLWEPYLPKRKGVLLEAPPGAKKTTLLVGGIAAALAQGKTPVTYEPCEPVRTLYLHGHDDDPSEIETLFRAGHGPAGSLVLVRHCPQLTMDRAGLANLSALVREHRAGLVIADPFKIFLPPNDGSDTDVMRVMAPIQEWWANNVSLIAVRHSKKIGGNAKFAAPIEERGLGSQAFFACFRGLLALQKHPDNTQQQRGVMVFTDEKGSTLNPKGEAFCFMRRGNAIEYLPDEPNPFDPGSEAPKAKADACALWLEDTLTGNTCSVAYIKEEADKRGFSDSTLRRARKNAKVLHTGDKRLENGGWLTIKNGSYQPHFDEN